MHKHTMHDRTARAREYYGKTAAEPLVEWLNRTSSKENDAARMGLERVLGIMKAILQLQEKAQTMISEGRWERKPRNFDNEAVALNEALEHYEFFYGVNYSKSAPMVWTLHSSEELTSSDPFPGETLAVLHIVELAKQGLLNKVRRCDCEMYFFARLPAQRFHTATCRIQFWETSPERKKRRREKAREYYHLHKSGKVR